LDKSQICAWKRSNKGLDERAKSVLGEGKIKNWIRAKICAWKRTNKGLDKRATIFAWKKD
jgi:hypothetical protein